MAHNRTGPARRDRDAESLYHQTTDSEEYDGDLTWWEREDKAKRARAKNALPTGTSRTPQLTGNRTRRFPTVGFAPHRETRTPTQVPDGDRHRPFPGSKRDPAWWERGKEGSRTSSPSRTHSRLNINVRGTRTHQASSPADMETLRLTALEFLKESKAIEEDYSGWQKSREIKLSDDLRMMKNEIDIQEKRKKSLERELKTLNHELRANETRKHALNQEMTSLRQDARSETQLITDLDRTLRDLNYPMRTVHHLRDGFKGDGTKKHSYIRLMIKFRDRLRRKRKLEVYDANGSPYNDENRLRDLKERIQQYEEIEREIEALSKANNAYVRNA